MDDDAAFAALFRSLHQQAQIVVNRQKDRNGDVDVDASVLKLLDAMTKVVFGVDERKKRIAVQQGSLELAVQLYECSSDHHANNSKNSLDAVLIATLKAIKSCVIRCNAGRRRCRAAKIFVLFQSILLSSANYCYHGSTMDEIFTTLAAICLGDDWNALQAALQLRSSMEASSNKYDKERNVSLHQKFTYLNKLFDAVLKEQEELVNAIIGTDTTTFFNQLTQLECLLLELAAANKDDSDSSSCLANEERCTEFLNFLSSLPPSPLLEPNKMKLLYQRSSLRIRVGDFHGALDDAEELVNHRNMDDSSKSHMLRAEALRGLGRKEEAKEAFAKALILNPGDEEMRSKMEQLSTSK